MPNRIAIYWHNGRGLGHTARAAALGGAILDVLPGSAVMGITGASKGFELLPSAMDFVKVPSFLAYDNPEGIISEPKIPLIRKEFRYIRSRLIETFMQDFHPEVLIADYYPEGRDGDLIAALIRSPNTKKILGLRGIMNDAAATNWEYFSPAKVDFIRDYYSAIHVYIDPNVFRMEQYYDVPPELLDMIHYTGYVTRATCVSKTEARQALGLPVDARIIVANFGGGQGTESMMQALLGSLSKLTGQYDYAYLTAGAYMEDTAFRRVQQSTFAYPQVTWVRMLTPFPLWMQASDLFIGAGGYNSLAEVVATRINALIIPRHLNESEQDIHAALLAERGIIRTATRPSLVQDGIADLIGDCLLSPFPDSSSPAVNTRGAHDNAEMVRKHCMGA